MNSLVGWIVCLLICSSCTSIYLPTSRNTPLFTGRGEFQTNVSVGNGTNLQAAYAFTDHVAIMMNGLYANSRTGYNYAYRRNYSGEAGLGYFSNGKYNFETFAGYGIGKGEGQDSTLAFLFNLSIEERASGAYKKIFLQPTIGRNIKNFQLALTTRFSFLDFSEIELSYNGEPQPTKEQELIFLEPSFTARYFTSPRPNVIFVFAQVGANIPLLDSDRIAFDYSVLNYSVGIGWALNRKRKA